MTEIIRVLLADDHPFVLNGIHVALDAESDMVVVGEATDGHEVQRLCRELQPDVVLLDLSMPGPTAFETIAYLRTHCPAVKVLMLTAYDDDSIARGLAAAGISGYVLKEEVPEVVIRAIRVVVQGGTWFSQSVAEKLFTRDRQGSGPSGTVVLTEREITILRLVIAGKTNNDIARTLDISEKTVEKHLKAIFTKFGVATRVEAAVQAVKAGMIRVETSSNQQEPPRFDN